MLQFSKAQPYLRTTSSSLGRKACALKRRPFTSITPNLSSVNHYVFFSNVVHRGINRSMNHSQLSLGHQRLPLSAVRTFSTNITSTTSTTKVESATENNETNDKDKKWKANNDSNKKKTAGDYFLDNLGTLFLSFIAIVIASLVRSSMGTSEKTKLRSDIEEFASALDPFEINDLRNANRWLDRHFMEYLIQMFSDRSNATNMLNIADGRLSYTDFIGHVSRALKEYSEHSHPTSLKMSSQTKSTPIPNSIQMGHLIDRVILSILNKRESITRTEGNTIKAQGDSPPLSQPHHDHDGRLPIQLLLVTLSLAMNGSIRDRVEILHQIMLLGIQGSDHVTGMSTNTTESSSKSSHHSSTTSLVKEGDIIQMIDYLQQTSQLVPDAQIVEAEVKYPYQKYKIASPVELVHYGKLAKKEELNPEVWDEASMREKNDSHGHDQHEGQSLWTCDDFHHLLRSRNVCAWGECYVKKRGLN